MWICTTGRLVPELCSRCWRDRGAPSASHAQSFSPRMPAVATRWPARSKGQAERVMPVYKRFQLIPGTKYFYLAWIGKGGYSEVIRVTNSVTIDENGEQQAQLRYALKLYAVLDDNLAEAEQLMLQELDKLRKLEHEGIVKAWDFGITEEEGGLRRPYLVMEYLHGQSLRTSLEAEQGQPISVGHVLNIMLQLLQAVQHAHNQGIIHRDLKPENIVFHRTTDGREIAKILDFGIAGLRWPQEGTNVPIGLLGTMLYMAPELWRGAAPTVQSDLYALGAIIYEMLAGQRPIGDKDTGNFGADVKAYSHGHQHVAPPPIRQFADVPEDLEELVMWMLRKDPRERPGRAYEVLERANFMYNRWEAEHATATLAPEFVTDHTAPWRRADFNRTEDRRPLEVVDDPELGGPAPENVEQEEAPTKSGQTTAGGTLRSALPATNRVADKYETPRAAGTPHFSSVRSAEPVVSPEQEMRAAPTLSYRAPTYDAAAQRTDTRPIHPDEIDPSRPAVGASYGANTGTANGQPARSPQPLPATNRLPPKSAGIGPAATTSSNLPDTNRLPLEPSSLATQLVAQVVQAPAFPAVHALDLDAPLAQTLDPDTPVMQTPRFDMPAVEAPDPALPPIVAMPIVHVFNAESATVNRPAAPEPSRNGASVNGITEAAIGAPADASEESVASEQRPALARPISEPPDSSKGLKWVDELSMAEARSIVVADEVRRHERGASGIATGDVNRNDRNAPTVVPGVAGPKRSDMANSHWTASLTMRALLFVGVILVAMLVVMAIYALLFRGRSPAMTSGTAGPPATMVGEPT
ncbi:protein kinase [Pendulispora brunnea]|uniref:non-specific serine/threonine protein kinase n=1 Tax=Pendulispora brunnea TaxID=2905690 RepID=A0ABZ2KIE7_9BACT